MVEPEQGFEHFVSELLAGLDLPRDLAREARDDLLEHLREDYHGRRARGASGDDARRDAIAGLGDRGELRRSLRATAARRRRATAGSLLGRAGHFIQSSWVDVRYATRSLLRSPGLALGVVLTIAIGIAANTAVFTVVNAVLLTALPYPEPERLVRVWPEKYFSEEMLLDLRERVSSLERISAYSPVRLTLLRQNEADVVDAMLVSVDHLSALGIAPQLGRNLRDEDQLAGRESVVVLSHDAWQRRFGGDVGILGRSISLGGLGYSERTVVGVMPSGYRAIEGTPEAWIPLSLDPESQGFFGAYGLRALGRLSAGVTARQAASEVAGLVAEFTDLHPSQFRAARFSPVDVVPLDETIVRGVRSTLLTLLGAVGFVLLIACSNVANLLLARSVARRREAAIRVSLGAGAARIVRQQLVESSLLALAGAAGGLALGQLLLSAGMQQLPRYVPRTDELGLDVRVLAFVLLAAAASALVFGTVPALRAVLVDLRGELVGAVRGTTQGGPTRRLNDTLVVVEVALAVVLVAGAGILLRSILELSAVDPGFEPERLVAIELSLPAGRYDEDAVRRAYFEEVIGSLQRIPDVEAVGGISLLPLAGGNRSFSYSVEGRPLPEGTPSLVGNVRIVTPGHFDAFGIRLQRGRILGDSETADGELVVLINETMARRHWDWPAEDPTGARFLDARGEPLFTVVGVVSDIRQQSLASETRPEFYLHAEQGNWQLRYVVARTRSAARPLVGSIVDAVRAIDPAVPVVAQRTMDEVMFSSLGSPRFFLRLFAAFAALGLALAMIGVYGVMSYTMRQRTREFGIRLALGAGAGEVLRLALRQAMVPIGLGITVGIAIGTVTTRSLTSLLYGVPPHDPITFGIVAVALAGVGALASWLPAHRASRIDPTVALVEE